jgi:hypothetical protein
LGEWRYSSTHSLTSALDGVEWSTSRPGRFTPRERAPGTHWIGGWVGPRAGLDAVVKRKIPSPRRESNPTTPIVQSVAQCYTDLTITALLTFRCPEKKICRHVPFLPMRAGSRDSSAVHGLDGRRFRVPGGSGNFFPSPPRPPASYQWVPAALSLGVKRLRCEADHSPISSAEVKNAWSYTSTPPIRLHGVVLS